MNLYYSISIYIRQIAVGDQKERSSTVSLSGSSARHPIQPERGRRTREVYYPAEQGTIGFSSRNHWQSLKVVLCEFITLHIVSFFFSIFFASCTHVRARMCMGRRGRGRGAARRGTAATVLCDCFLSLPKLPPFRTLPPPPPIPLILLPTFNSPASCE